MVGDDNRPPTATEVAMLLALANLMTFSVILFIVAYQNPNLNDVWVLIESWRLLWR